jgi:hypothetical protein
MTALQIYLAIGGLFSLVLISQKQASPYIHVLGLGWSLFMCVYIATVWPALVWAMIRGRNA